MTKKTYSSTTVDVAFIYPVEINGVKTTHAFSLEQNNTISIVDPDKQKAIEESKYFKKGIIVIKSEVEATEAEIAHYNKTRKKEAVVVDIAINNSAKSQKVQEATQIGVQTEQKDDILEEVETLSEETPIEIEIIVYDDVENINQAKDVLKKLGATPQSLRNPDMIKNKAIELKVEFPNLKF